MESDSWHTFCKFALSASMRYFYEDELLMIAGKIY